MGCFTIKYHTGVLYSRLRGVVVPKNVSQSFTSSWVWGFKVPLEQVSPRPGNKRKVLCSSSSTAGEGWVPGVHLVGVPRVAWHQVRLALESASHSASAGFVRRSRPFNVMSARSIAIALERRANGDTALRSPCIHASPARCSLLPAAPREGGRCQHQCARGHPQHRPRLPTALAASQRHPASGVDAWNGHEPSTSPLAAAHHYCPSCHYINPCALPTVRTWPMQVSYGGEDAHFISDVLGGALGVADGVGGWKEEGINPAGQGRAGASAAPACSLCMLPQHLFHPQSRHLPVDACRVQQVTDASGMLTPGGATDC